VESIPSLFKTSFTGSLTSLREEDEYPSYGGKCVPSELLVPILLLENKLLLEAESLTDTLDDDVS